MKRHRLLSALLSALLLVAALLPPAPARACAAPTAEPPRDNALWVNPMTGTALSTAPTLWGNYGGTYPGAVSPWGMVQLSPETSRRPSERGYYYSDTSILTFTCLGHKSGYPNGSAGRLALMFMRGSHEALPPHYAGRPFSHSSEEAQPGFYSVRFDDGDRVSMAAATHAGIVRYSTACDTTTVVLCQGGGISVVSPAEVHCADSHSILTFSLPMTRHTLRGDTLFAQFGTTSVLDVCLSVSSSGFGRSRSNGAAQLSGGDFEAVRRRTYADWSRQLQCVDINGAPDSLMRMFYTALYHSMLMPCNVADVGGEPRYSGFSPWDTFRTLHPLLALLKPQVQSAMVDAMLDECARRGTLPKGPMTGCHAVAVLLDSYVKGATRRSAAALYEACRRSFGRWMQGRAARQYMHQGYVGAGEEQSVSVTAELAYDDWAMMRFCRIVGDSAAAAVHASRARNYARLWDAETLFMLPRDSTGFLRRSGGLGYQESDRWTASLFAPHDVQHLVNLCGGARHFAERLQSDFARGRILFDNETVLHCPWLYVWARRPDLAARCVRSIATECYADTPGGIPGNDDLGSMSSWLAFAVMGLMPACPGTDEYIIMPPLAQEVVLHFPSGKTMRIRGGGMAEGAAFPRPLLNGTPLNRCHITHAELTGGGTLLFDSCACVDASLMQLPYSFSSGEPRFEVKMCGMPARTVRPDDALLVPFRIGNGGADGICRVFLTCGTDTVASKNVFVAAGSSVADTLVCRLYAEGRHTLRMGGDAVGVTVKKAHKGSLRLSCTHISVCPVAKRGAPLAATVRVKNVGGRVRREQVPVIIDGQARAALGVHLLPGEERSYELSLPAFYADGMHTVSVLGHAEKVKVYADAMDAAVLDVDFPDGKAVDKSGFGNDGRCFGALRWGGGTLTTAQNAYVEFPASASLMHPYQRFTMLAWVCPLRNEGSQYIDFFTKGDYTLMKLQGSGRLGFFAGGWGRGECEVPVPDDWEGRWHLLAGVCSEGSIRIYIDGRLCQTVSVKGTVQESEMQWNLGRNAEMPFSRFGNLTFKGVRIYAEALDDDMIMRIYRAEK